MYRRLLGLLLAGIAAHAHATDPAGVLGGYHWQLDRATASDGQRLDALFAHPDKPLQLDFSDGHLRISHTCNVISGSYHIEGHTLDIGRLMHTMMFCADKPLMAMEQMASQRLQGPLDFALLGNDAQPQLRLTTVEGDTLLFTGRPTPATRFGSTGTTEFLEVAAHTVPCKAASGAARTCLWVRQRHYGSNGLQAGPPGTWHVLDQPIEGYAHRPGIRNVLRVKRYVVRHPVEGQPGHAYVLDMVVETHAQDAKH
ncbi:META and DUF4377 domain-containing protein [Dyella sp. A6]|uniref:META and DUF4377 domain-containing protein n=1 Tax=Dyella aluminiiresistens TaxID=3069105 RepID=UPI002E781BA5|nr:META and DUF4377 domain-containing protein [Dyella sp. A6]